ncbi:uncharacterized protein LOC119615299 [Lucilia sericata]|uniref:uncharacterized protein LOC119615299 n=1 Tax=Lucilia sericata TaxID=13632 RepID=UPI0018A8567D|nr:uncharacterized protein LOC119615299 [Lucilia sericata]
MLNYLKFLIILLITNYCWSVPPLTANKNNYLVFADEKSFIQSCSPEDNAVATNVDNFLELNLRHDFDEDMETLITNGNITMKVDIPYGIQLALDMEIFMWKRGRWEKLCIP